VERLSERLRRAAEPLWREQLEHPFVRGIADASLDSERFRRFVRQDYLFLVEYARALAFAAARAPTLELMDGFAEAARSTLRDELEIHRAYAAEWGIAREELERERMTATTRAYTDFLVRECAAAPYPELVAALLPCMWGYSELGRALAREGVPPDHRFATWVDAYASDEFAGLASWCRDALDEVAGTCPAEEAALRDAFLTSSRYELAFWVAAWRLEEPLPGC
jgi:thiaminase/transcriptional activator TenA